MLRLLVCPAAQSSPRQDRDRKDQIILSTCCIWASTDNESRGERYIVGVMLDGVSAPSMCALGKGGSVSAAAAQTPSGRPCHVSTPHLRSWLPPPANCAPGLPLASL